VLLDRAQDKEDRFRAKLAGYDVPDPELEAVIREQQRSGGHSPDAVPEPPPTPTPAWKRALEMNAERRRN
jgi:hypothetical protein